MYMGNNNQNGVTRLDESGRPLEPTKYGKFYRDPGDPLLERPIPNDPTLSWAKETFSAWHVSAKKNHKGHLLHTIFQSKEAYDSAIDSGEYFDSPVKAEAAKKSKINKEVADLSAQLSDADNKIKAETKKAKVGK